jgi:hypothetical protein
MDDNKLCFDTVKTADDTLLPRCEMQNVDCQEEKGYAFQIAIVLADA